MGRTFREDMLTEFQEGDMADFGEALAKVDIAFTLAHARMNRDVKQKDLAAKLGTTQSYVAKLERGDANPSVAQVGRVLALLGLRLSVTAIPLSPHGKTRTAQPTAESAYVSRNLGDPPAYSTHSEDTVPRATRELLLARTG